MSDTGPAFICVSVHQDLIEAEVTRGLIESHDIPCDLHNAHLVTADWMMSMATGGIRVMVPNEHAAEAIDILRRYKAGELTLTREDGLLSDEAVDEVPAPPTCPFCGSGNIMQVPTRGRNVAMLLMFVFSLAVFAGGNENRCRDCSKRFHYT